MAGSLANTIDTYLAEDLKPEMPDVSGPLAVALRLYRRLTTPRGMFPFWPNKGYCIINALLAKIPPWQIKANIEAECNDDEQVLDSSALVVPASDGRSITVTVRFTTAEGSYAFTMTASEASATLVSLQKAA